MPLMAAVAVGAMAGAAHAGGKGRECKPSGSANQLGQTGAVAVAQPVEYWSKPWLLLTDKPTKPDKVRLVSADGQVIEIGKPPITVEPIQWLARGRAVYALGKGRSQTPGKTDVVMMRWGTDPRPRLTNLHTGVVVEGQMSAAFSNEFLALTWAERDADGALHRMLMIMDSEDPRVSEPKDLGIDDGAAARVQPLATKGFSVLWTSADGLKRATFDSFGKSSAPTATMAWPAPAPAGAKAIAVLQCADRSWVVREIDKQLALDYGDPGGKLKELTRMPVSASDEMAPMQCAADSLVIGRRTLDTKAGNVTLWVSTVDTNGKVHERRVRDKSGSAADIRIPQLIQEGAKLTSFWIEGEGADAKVWSRELSCE
jgi:hypothetical protein